MAKKENDESKEFDYIEYMDDYFPRPETGGVEGAMRRVRARERALKRKEAMEKAKRALKKHSAGSSKKAKDKKS